MDFIQFKDCDPPGTFSSSKDKGFNPGASGHHVRKCRIGNRPPRDEYIVHDSEFAGVLFVKEILVSIASAQSLESVDAGGIVENSFCARETEIGEGEEAAEDDFGGRFSESFIDFHGSEESVAGQIGEDLELYMVRKARLWSWTRDHLEVIGPVGGGFAVDRGAGIGLSPHDGFEGSGRLAPKDVIAIVLEVPHSGKESVELCRGRKGRGSRRLGDCDPAALAF
jgi:hypothetical protein